MDKAKVLEIADVLENIPDDSICTFDLTEYADAECEEINLENVFTIECNTHCCVAGWTVLHFDKKILQDDYASGGNIASTNIPLRAMEILDLNYRQAEDLFYGPKEGVPTSAYPNWEINPKEAARCIREYVAKQE